MTNTIKNLNKRTQDESIMTFDFSTIYNMMPNSKLMKNLYNLTDFCFDEDLHKYTTANKFDEKWDNPYNYYLVWSVHLKKQ